MSDAPTDPAQLPLADKVSLSSGAAFFTTKAVGGVPTVVLMDGPHGLRKPADRDDHMGLGPSVPATCFPPACGLGQSWDTDLVGRVAASLADECRHHGVDVLLGPGVNVKRSPLGGRSFEYFSEDPVVSAALATAWVEGLQGGGVGASLKHFAANDQETDRMRVSADVDPRPLREVHLRAFQRVVEEAQPWTVMCSYNRVNGVPASEHAWLLTQVLREEWGFDGVVVSDWGAVTDRVAAASAGLDLEMPSSGGTGDEALVTAVENGRLDEAVVDRMARRVAGLAARATAARAASPVPDLDLDAHHALAREAARRSVVLLRNEGSLLPLAPGTSVAVVGDLALHPRFQGGGSSHVNPSRVDVPLEHLVAVGGDRVTHANDPESALAAARAADAAVVFLGLPERAESEGFDRTDLDLPAEQVDLALAVLDANPRTVVVLTRGGVVRLAPLAGVPAILDGALLGQGGGAAIADVVFGEVNPSGRLTETVPERLQDTPAHLDFPGEHGHVRYGEGLFVGYRWYDARDVAVTFPFGHGLSYTTFEHADLQLEETPDGITATVTVTNTGARAGREVVQLYSSVPGSAVVRPERELKAFTVVEVEPGQQVRASALLRRQDLAYWDTRVDRWVVEPGEYVVWSGASSRDLRTSATVSLAGDVVSLPLTTESTFAEILAHPASAEVLMATFGFLLGETEGDPESSLGHSPRELLAQQPIGRIVTLSGGIFGADQVTALVAAANAALSP